MNAMRILVVDDKDMHRQSARETLEGHELTVVSSFDEAIEQLKEKDKYDAVLTDLKLPMSSAWPLSRDAYRRDKNVLFRGELVDYGFVIALRAALRGVKYIAVVTDVNHHQDAMSAALDQIEWHTIRAFVPNFIINGARCMFVHAPFVDIMHKGRPCSACQSSGVCRFCNGTGARNDEHVQGPRNVCAEIVGTCEKCKGTGKADEIEHTDRKDWGEVLKDLITEMPEPISRAPDE